MTSENDDLTGLARGTIEELVQVLAKAVKHQFSKDKLERFGRVLFGRTLYLLRQGARTQMLDECVDLDRFLTSKVGRSVQDAHPDLYGSWAALSDLLGEGGRRSDRAAVESILRSHRGRGQAVLEMLAERGGPMRRGEIRDRLGRDDSELSESHLSHLLRDLDEADIIVRNRDSGREVEVDLGPVGRELIDSSLVPRWIELVIEQVRKLGDEGLTLDTQALKRDLMNRGAPSDLVARRLAEALAQSHRLVSQRAEENIRRLGDEIVREDPRFELVRESNQRPVHAFSLQ